MSSTDLTREDVAALPKVLLHDHLDGGLRPETLLELADEVGHELPASDPQSLAQWFRTAASSGSLEDYLTTFSHTTTVMQSADHLRRVAAEAVEDLAADGVVHAELRYAPELHQSAGLSGDDVIEAVSDGITTGVERAAEAGRTIHVVQILVIMRQADNGKETAELALRWRNAGVGAVDLAGPEAGFSPVRHQHALRMLRKESMPVTIHAGEADGVQSISDAVLLGGALRIGHGVRLVEDIEFGPLSPEDPWGLTNARLGDLAHWVRDQQITLEVCPTSNLDTHVVASRGLHPITPLHRLGFATTVSTDNRLMSGTSLTDELYALVTDASWTIDDLREVTMTAAWSAFIHHDERKKLVEGTIVPAFSPTSKGRHRA